MNAPSAIADGRTAAFLRYWLAERRDLDPEVLALELTSARLNLLSRKSLARLTRASGISAQDHTLLAMIKRGGPDGPLRPSDLWKVLQLTPAGVTYHVGQLVTRGLVVRHSDPDDRRAVLLKLTPAGAEIVETVMTATSSAMSERLADLSDADRRTLTRLMGMLARRWEQIEELAEAPAKS